MITYIKFVPPTLDAFSEHPYNLSRSLYAFAYESMKIARCFKRHFQRVLCHSDKVKLEYYRMDYTFDIARNK